MQLTEIQNMKNAQSGDKIRTIRITVGQQYKDDSHKSKFKSMLIQIGIPLSILLFLITSYITFKLYEFHPFSSTTRTTTTETSGETYYSLNTESDEYDYHDRVKRQQEENFVDEDLRKSLESAVARCKKNMEKSKDCCDLWSKVKELNKVMDDVKKEFGLTDVPCKHKEDFIDKRIKNWEENSSELDQKNEIDDSYAKNEDMNGDSHELVVQPKNLQNSEDYEEFLDRTVSGSVGEDELIFLSSTTKNSSSKEETTIENVKNSYSTTNEYYTISNKMKRPINADKLEEKKTYPTTVIILNNIIENEKENIDESQNNKYFSKESREDISSTTTTTEENLNYKFAIKRKINDFADFNDNSNKFIPIKKELQTISTEKSYEINSYENQDAQKDLNLNSNEEMTRNADLNEEYDINVKVKIEEPKPQYTTSSSLDETYSYTDRKLSTTDQQEIPNYDEEKTANSYENISNISKDNYNTETEEKYNNFVTKSTSIFKEEFSKEDNYEKTSTDIYSIEAFSKLPIIPNYEEGRDDFYENQKEIFTNDNLNNENIDDILEDMIFKTTTFSSLNENSRSEEHIQVNVIIQNKEDQTETTTQSNIYLTNSEYGSFDADSSKNSYSEEKINDINIQIDKKEGTENYIDVSTNTKPIENIIEIMSKKEPLSTEEYILHSKEQYIASTSIPSIFNLNEDENEEPDKYSTTRNIDISNEDRNLYIESSAPEQDILYPNTNQQNEINIVLSSSTSTKNTVVEILDEYPQENEEANQDYDNKITYILNEDQINKLQYSAEENNPKQLYPNTDGINNYITPTLSPTSMLITENNDEKQVDVSENPYEGYYNSPLTKYIVESTTENIYSPEYFSEESNQINSNQTQEESNVHEETKNEYKTSIESKSSIEDYTNNKHSIQNEETNEDYSINIQIDEINNQKLENHIESTTINYSKNEDDIYEYNNKKDQHFYEQNESFNEVKYSTSTINTNKEDTMNNLNFEYDTESSRFQESYIDDAKSTTTNYLNEESSSKEDNIYSNKADSQNFYEENESINDFKYSTSAVTPKKDDTMDNTSLENDAKSSRFQEYSSAYIESTTTDYSKENNLHISQFSSTNKYDMYSNKKIIQNSYEQNESINEIKYSTSTMNTKEEDDTINNPSYIKDTESTGFQESSVDDVKSTTTNSGEENAYNLQSFSKEEDEIYNKKENQNSDEESKSINDITYPTSTMNTVKEETDKSIQYNEYSTNNNLNSNENEDYNINVQLNVEDGSGEKIYPIVSPFTEENNSVIIALNISNSKETYASKSTSKEDLNGSESQINEFATRIETKPENNKNYESYEEKYYNPLNKANYDKEEPKIENFPKNSNRINYQEEVNDHQIITVQSNEMKTKKTFSDTNSNLNKNYNNIISNEFNNILSQEQNNQNTYSVFQENDSIELVTEDNNNNTEDITDDSSREIVQPAETNYEDILKMSNLELNKSNTTQKYEENEHSKKELTTLESHITSISNYSSETRTPGNSFNPNYNDIENNLTEEIHVENRNLISEEHEDFYQEPSENTSKFNNSFIGTAPLNQEQKNFYSSNNEIDSQYIEEHDTNLQNEETTFETNQHIFDLNESTEKEYFIPRETVSPLEPEKQIFLAGSEKINGRKKYETSETDDNLMPQEVVSAYEASINQYNNYETQDNTYQKSKAQNFDYQQLFTQNNENESYEDLNQDADEIIELYETPAEDINPKQSNFKSTSEYKTNENKFVQTKETKTKEDITQIRNHEKHVSLNKSQEFIFTTSENYFPITEHNSLKNRKSSGESEDSSSSEENSSNKMNSHFQEKTTVTSKTNTKSTHNKEEISTHTSTINTISEDKNATVTPIAIQIVESTTLITRSTTQNHSLPSTTKSSMRIKVKGSKSDNTVLSTPSTTETFETSTQITTSISKHETDEKGTLFSSTITETFDEKENVSSSNVTEVFNEKENVSSSTVMEVFDEKENVSSHTVTEVIDEKEIVSSSTVTEVFDEKQESTQINDKSTTEEIKTDIKFSTISTTEGFKKDFQLVDLDKTENPKNLFELDINNKQKNQSETQIFETSTSVVTSTSIATNSPQIDSILGSNQNINNLKLVNDFIIHETQNPNLRSQNQLQNGNMNDMRIVNQNQIAQRVQNIGLQQHGGGFDNLFQLPPIESSKASQQLTVNTNMLPMCFYGMPNQNAPAFRQPGYDSQISPFSPTHTAYSAFGYPQMYPNNMGQQAMNNYYNNMMSQQKFGSSNFMNHNMQNPYFCTYVPSSSLQFPPVSGMSDFRNTETTDIPILDDPDDKSILIDIFSNLNSNKSRSSMHCRLGERSCFDGKKCIRDNQWCDGIVQCHDQSDELGCPCKTRVDKSRLCDGYFDCPNGEDELGCFGCNENEFSCDDWTDRRKTATCVPFEERCDGRSQCKTGKDEMDCSLLTNTINVHQTYAVSKSSGYLHRNYKGNWYPVCSNTDNWVLDACLAEVGPQATFPLIRMLPVPSQYKGKFLTAIPDKKVEFLNACMGGEAIYVICPPIPCGTRLIPPPNHFRKHEVDTSAEEDFLPFVSRLRRFTDEIQKHETELLGTNDFEEKIFQDYKIHLDDKEEIINSFKQPKQQEKRGKRGDSRVVGGKPSQPTSWPWVVAIYRDGIFHCGGVLMSELWVITAAHCIDMYWQHYYEVQAGMLRRFSYSPMEQNRVVSNIIGHQMYDRSDMKNDLALLKMSRPFQFNRWVRPVCLPSESSAGPNWLWGPTPGIICTAVGWGATIEHGPDPDHMREVEVPILPHCKHREDEEGQEICAGYLEGGRDACQGDSGGPLLCRNPLAPSQWYVAGIVSHGEGCARPNEPGAYTRVSLYLNWITRSILDENLPGKRPLLKCPGTLCMGTHRCISKKRRCDKTIDCLVGDDELNCPTSNFPSLIKHALDNMLLFSTNNATTEDPIKSVENNNHKNVRIADVLHRTENDNITTSSAFRDDGGQATAMNRNDDISSTFMTPVGEISDATRPVTNATAAANTAQRPSITATTFITTNDTISESSTSRMSAHAPAPVNDVTLTTPIHNDSNSENVTSSVIYGSRGALNIDGKNMDDARRKNFTQDMNATTEISIMGNGNKKNTNINADVVPDKFVCKNLIQVITISRRCNRIIDCEDGTDEMGCSCKEYLAAYYPEAICDGTMDCEDGGDEKNCNDCPGSKFYCHLSGQCIPKFFQCDYKSDCLFGEDEWDCFALTNGSFIRYDKDERPELRRKGIISVSHAGIWYPMCKSEWYDIAPDVADDMCIYLGFGGYQKFYETFTIQDSIRQIPMDTHPIALKPTTNDTCRALYVKCTNSLSENVDVRQNHAAHQTGVNTFKEILISPWNAGIFVNGYYICSGTLIDKIWVVTSRLCLDDVFLYANYTTVMLGSGKGHQNVVGPHEQIRRISAIVPVTNTDIILLRLHKSVTSTRYVRPLYLRKANNIVTEKETCIAMGRDINETLQSIFLKPILHKCLVGERCFNRVSPNIDCEESISFSPWGGTIVCLSPIGWYPAAVFYEKKGQCGFKTNSGFSSIRFLTPNIFGAMNNEALFVNPPICNGFRCPLGQCIEPDRICDGTANCRDGSDESRANCQKKSNECQSKNNCECAQTQMRCNNGKCVAKSAFCDRRDDCGDLSDEPPICNCSSYLALVAPHQICDGIRNCYDKSDENPDVCRCGKNSFKCGTSGLCISNDFVCDGETDCPDMEDETQCTALFAKKQSRDGVGELMLRTYGVWHSFCMPETPLTAKQLEDICIDLSFTGAHASIHNTTVDANSALVISIDQFSFVKLNTDAMLYLRGDYPLATLKRSVHCKTMYLECT